MKVINESTPLSMGIATAITALALSFGIGIEHFRFRIMHVEQQVAARAEWKATVDGVLVELKDITKRHEWRLERLEREARNPPVPEKTKPGLNDEATARGGDGLPSLGGDLVIVAAQL